MNRTQTVALCAAALGLACCGGSQIDIDSGAITAPTFALELTPSVIEGKSGNSTTLGIRFEPGRVGGQAPDVASVTLSTDAPDGLFIIPQSLSSEDFVDNLAQVDITLLHHVLTDQSYKIMVSGEDAIARQIDTSSLDLRISAANGQASFAPLISNPSSAVEYAVYLWPTVTPSDDNQIELQVLFQGSRTNPSDPDSCVQSAAFHLEYGDGVQFVGDTQGTFLNDANTLYQVQDKPVSKKVVVGIARFGCVQARTDGPELLMSMRFQVLVGIPLSLNFTNTSLADNGGIRNEMGAWIADQGWFGGTLETVVQ